MPTVTSSTASVGRASVPAIPGGLATLAVRNAVMSELFEDQVNVVQAVVAGARRSLLFTRGDGAKPLR